MFLLVAYGYQTTNEDSSRLWPDFNAIFFGFLFIFFLDSIEKWSISILVLTWCFYWSPMVTERPMRIRVCCDPIFFYRELLLDIVEAEMRSVFFCLFVFCFFFLGGWLLDDAVRVTWRWTMAPHYVGASRGFSIKFSLRLPDCERDSSFLCSLRSDGPFHNIPIPLSLSLSLSLSGFQRVSYPVGSVRLGLFVFFFLSSFLLWDFLGCVWFVLLRFDFGLVFFSFLFFLFSFFFVGAGSEVMPGLMGRRRVGNLWMDSFFLYFYFFFFWRLSRRTSSDRTFDYDGGERLLLRRLPAKPAAIFYLFYFYFFFFFAGGFYRRWKPENWCGHVVVVAVVVVSRKDNSWQPKKTTETR